MKWSKSGGRGPSGLWILVVSLFFACVAIVLFLSITGQRKTTLGSNGEVEHVRSLTCESDDFLYPYLKFDESDKKEFRIIVTFNGDEIRAISLQQMLYYNSDELIVGSEAENHAAINLSFAGDGLMADAFRANFAKLSDGLRISLYGMGEQMGNEFKKYFLLDTVNDANHENILQNYEAMGLKCVGKNDIN
ncbi:hypothetical protein J6X73_03295 [Candidatus Saccharibacteria bacterium]|nr:hypothetical protein [Candidatus Saccharibacteria bacterium]